MTEGTYGDFGGRFMPEALIAELDRLTEVWHESMADPEFTGEFDRMLREYAGVPSLLYDATRLSEVAGARISTTPGPTRSATCWARRCLRSGWARPG